MENLNISHQTLREFIDAPFGLANNQKNLKYEDRYRVFRDNNKITIESTLEFEKNYFIHLKIPSESQKGETLYDVVIQFFSPNEDTQKQLSVENYYVQFYSNSPGFIYKYASLYKLEGYLIETLSTKFSPEALTTLPDKANKTYELYYDSTIYYASRYLLDYKLFLMSKLNLKLRAKKSTQKFFSDIMDADTKNLTRGLGNVVNNLKTEINKDNKLSQTQESKLKHSKNGSHFAKEVNHKKEATKAKSSTMKDSSLSSIKRKSGSSKKVARKTTTKK